MRIAVVLAIALVTLGCTPVEQPDVLPEHQYEKLLIELRMLSEYKMATSDSLLTSRLADSIFKVNGVSPETFYRSHTWYESDPSSHAARLGRLADSLSVLDTRLSTPRD